MKHRLVVYVENGTTTNTAMWRQIDAEVQGDKAQYNRLLEARQLQESLQMEPLSGEETIADRQDDLGPIAASSWLELYVCEPVMHTGPEKCLKGATCMLVAPGTEAIAADYQAKGVRCLTINPTKSGRWFPLLSPLQKMPADLSEQIGEADRWSDGVSSTN